MKLEIKHLACYLPYGLKIYQEDIKDGYEEKYTILVGVGEMGVTTDLTAFIEFEFIKPILRPLSDLTKEIEIDGEKFMPSKYLFGQNMGNPNIYIGMGVGRIKEWLRKPETWKVYQWQQTIEWHFDVFGLIEDGLAIDINTL